MSSQRIDPAARARQRLAAATEAARRAIDAALPQLTSFDVRLPRTSNRENEPNPSTSLAAAGENPHRPTSSPVPRATVDPRRQALTQVDARLQQSQTATTNPMPSAEGIRTTLNARQLAAARLLACGRRPADVAAELGITRQALWTWRRRADFRGELIRVHERLIWAAGATRRSR